MRIAILDNYNDLAQGSADWSVLSSHDVTFFNTHEADEAKVIAQLAPFDILGVMRERTPPTPCRSGAIAQPQNGHHDG